MSDERAAAGRGFVLDELLDLTLYRRLEPLSSGELRAVLGELIPIETGHLQFWKSFFGIEAAELDWGRRLKLEILVVFCRLFGPVGIHLTLEAIEIYGIRKYLHAWERYKGTPLGDAVKGVLADEFEHEDEIVSRAGSRRIDPERVRGVFLGFNDGLVEILGAVSGFFASLGDARLVLMAGASVAAAGAFSMGAGAFAAASSENEIRDLEEGRRRFLGQAPEPREPARPWQTGLLVGVCYMVGAAVPLLPVALGARSLWAPAAVGGLMSLLVSWTLSFLSGMEPRRRIALNAGMVACAVAVSFLVGRVARLLWGIDV